MLEDFIQNVWRHSVEYKIRPIPRITHIPFPVPVILVTYIAFPESIVSWLVSRYYPWKIPGKYLYFSKNPDVYP